MTKYQKDFLRAVCCFVLTGALMLFGSGVMFASADEPVTITMVEQDLVSTNPDDVAYMEAVNKLLLDSGVNAKIELVNLTQENYAEKLNLLIIGGNIPDIMWFRDDVDKKIAEQGLLVDLTEYVKNSEVFQKTMPPWNKRRLENYPYLLAIQPITPKIAAIRKDLVERLNLEIPVTVEDYYQVLKTIADADIDGKDMYGLTVTGNALRLDNIFNAAFDVPTTWIQDENGKYIYAKVSPNEKKKLAFYRKLHEENILDPEFITDNWQSMEDKFYAGKTGMIIGTSGIVIDMYGQRIKAKGIDTELIPLHPPKGENGGQGFEPVNINRESRGFGISALSKHPELAFKVLEVMATDQGQFLDRLGLEGREYNKGADGSIELTERGEIWYPRFFDIPSWKSPVQLRSEVSTRSLEIVNSYYIEDVYVDIPSELGPGWDAMNNLYKEYSYKIISGEYPLEKFEEFVEKWYQSGGEELTAYANKILQ